MSWATLGLAYVQQAKVTVDPSYYPKADGALAKSLEINDTRQLPRLRRPVGAGLGPPRLRRRQALRRAGPRINATARSSTARSSDAEIQLGDYDAGFASIDKMVDLRPDTASLYPGLVRVELRGDVDRATALMQRALDDAPTAPTGRSRCSTSASWRSTAAMPTAALDLYNRAARRVARATRRRSPARPRPRRRSARPRPRSTTTHALVDRYPEPSYVLEYGELLESLGRTDEAAAAVRRVRRDPAAVRGQRRRARRAPTLFHADHGDPAAALAAAERGIATRPFLAMHDAYAWALHVNGRDAEALVGDRPGAADGHCAARCSTTTPG